MLQARSRNTTQRVSENSPLYAPVPGVPVRTTKPVIHSVYVRKSPMFLAWVLGMHAVLLIGLLHRPTAHPPVMLPQALSVSLIVPEIDTRQPQKPVPQKKVTPAPPKPVIQPKPLPPVLAVEHAAPSPTSLPVQAPTPVQAEAPKTLPTEPQTPPVPAQTAEPQAPEPVPPRFNADYLDNPEPSYPALSRRLKEEGEVRLRVWVDAAGAPSRVALSRSSGFERLDRIALETVQRWRFTPARQGDQAIAAQVIVPVTFNLKD